MFGGFFEEVVDFYGSLDGGNLRKIKTIATTNAIIIFFVGFELR
jgi:hypothetical protein